MIPDGLLDLNSDLKGQILRNEHPDVQSFSAEEAIVLMSFLDGPKRPAALLDEEYSDALGQGLLDANTICATLTALLSKGLLVSSIETELTSPGFGDAEARDAYVTIQSISRLARRVGDDLAGLGSYAHFNCSSEKSISNRLAEVRGTLAEVLEELKRLREFYLCEQLRRVGICSETQKLRLNIGSGFKPLPSPWVNIDLSGRGDVSFNVLWGLPFGDASVDYIYSSHVLEHLDYRSGVQTVLRDWCRVLIPGGRVRLAVPNIRGYIAAYLENNATFFEDRLAHAPFLRFILECKLEHVLDYAGAGMRARPGEFFEHKFGYDLELLSSLLYKAGFGSVLPSEYMMSSDPNLCVDDAGTFAAMTFAGVPNSLFVEARK